MDIQKKTKIVATIGPVTSSAEKLAELLEAGLNIVRLNFSHGDFAEHQKKVDNLKIAMKKTGLSAAVLQDLGGPKIRIGDFKDGMVTLKEGATFTITTDKVEGTVDRVSVNYPMFAKEVAKGHIVFLHDGRKKLEVLEVKGNDVICKVLVGGEIKGKRGVNLPDSDLSISALTDKDKSDIAFGIKNKVDFFALSFVRRAEDITDLRKILDAKKSNAKIIAKIETPQALENIDAILALTDGIMVARGDLAIEIPAENVPSAQKMLIRKCNELGKPVITATQMLESMIKAPVPTRAEVSDVANAIIDGTDAIMLSEETTLGDFPVESVKMMTRIANKIENDEVYLDTIYARRDDYKGMTDDQVDAITSEAVDIADRVGAVAIVALTHSGFTASMIARFRPMQPLVVFTTNEVTARQTLLTFGTLPVLDKKFKTLTEALTDIKKYVVKNKLAVKGDKIVISGGIPFEKPRATNMVLVETV